MADEKRVTKGVFNLAKKLISEGVEIQAVKAAVVKRYMEDGRDGGTAKKYANITVCMAKRKVNAKKNGVVKHIEDVKPIEVPEAKAPSIEEQLEVIEEVEKNDEVSEEFWKDENNEE